MVVLVSGSGTNLQAIIDAIQEGILDARIAAVISNQSSAFGLQRAEKAGIETKVLTKKTDQTRRFYDSELAEIVKSYQPDLIILAGWMRLLSANFLDQFPEKVINLHPALPGMFPGIHAIERAFEAYQRKEIGYTGVMVHLVPDEGVDSGPVLNKEIVPIYPSDSLESLEERIHQCEHKLLVETVRQQVEKTLTGMDGKTDA